MDPKGYFHKQKALPQGQGACASVLFASCKAPHNCQEFPGPQEEGGAGWREEKGKPHFTTELLL